ncbi:glycosyltransferase family 4 protein [Chloroflexota bacterium]
MLVLYIIPYKWGGLSHYTMELANAASKYAEVVVITPKGFSDCSANNRIKIMEIIDAPEFSTDKPLKAFLPGNWRCFAPSYNLKKIIDGIKPDIIHLTTLLVPPLISTLIFYRIDRKYPIIITKHGIFSDSGGFTRILESGLLYFEKMIPFQHTIVHNQKDRETLINRGNHQQSKISVIPHGVYSFFTSLNTQFTAERNCILFFGYIKPYKGLEYLLKAVPIVAKRIQGLKVIIAGEGDMSPYESLLLTNSDVEFEIYNEFVSNEKAAEFFQRAEIVVLPYSIMRSGQSGILHIAFAFNKPVVATHVGGIPEAVEDGKTGFIVIPRDEIALAQRIIMLLNDDNLRKEMSRNIEKTVGNISWDVVARKTIDIYKKVAGVV